MRGLPFTLACVAGTGLLLCGAAVVSASGPVGGSRYTGVSRDRTAWAELDVARSGEGLRARGSSIELARPGCRERPAVLGLPSRAERLRIGPAKRFAFTSRGHGLRLRASGRFATRNTLVLGLRYRRLPASRCGAGANVRLILRRVRRGHPAGCGQRGRTLAWMPAGRVFQHAVATGDLYVPYVNHAFGCLFSPGRVFHLDEDQDPDSDLRLFRLAAPYAAYAVDACPMGCGYGVTVVDLRTGQKLRELGIGTEGGPGGRATDLELSPSGSAAWIVDGLQDQVKAYDSAGERVLDSGAGIALRSLRLSGTTLTWTKGGVLQSATLR